MRPAGVRCNQRYARSASAVALNLYFMRDSSTLAYVVFWVTPPGE